MQAALTSSDGLSAPEAEREKGAVTAATHDRDLECPFFSTGPALPGAPASGPIGGSPASKECARGVVAEDGELSTAKPWLSSASLAAVAPFRLSSAQHNCL